MPRQVPSEYTHLMRIFAIFIALGRRFFLLLSGTANAQKQQKVNVECQGFLRLLNGMFT